MTGILMTFKYTLTGDDGDALREAAEALDAMQGCVEASMKDGYSVDVRLDSADTDDDDQ